MVVAGIDEAGRGPVIGPMVVAIVAVSDEEKLAKVGVKDSKELSREGREAAYRKILKIADCVNYLVTEPATIDSYVSRHMLNALELDAAAKLISTCPADRYIVDSPDPNPARYAAALSMVTGARVEAYNRAERFPVVAAASIVAKVVRDRIIARLEELYGEFGSGYPSDPRTIRAIVEGRVPRPCIRWSWKTVRRLLRGGL